jgi:transcriptional antiterminator RfaH
MPQALCDNEPTPWYVCHTKPRQESLAVRKLVEQGYEVYLPMLAKWERKKGAWHKTEQVMFPRYSFVRCVRPGQSIAPIRCTPGVSGLVRFGAEPATLDAYTVETIHLIAEQSAIGQEAKPAPFSVGEAVKVADGPLKGLDGVVSLVAEKRVIVLLSLLGREKNVAIPVNHLAAA